jgi:predicted CXXCH cytochrome family protein
MTLGAEGLSSPPKHESKKITFQGNFPFYGKDIYSNIVSICFSLIKIIIIFFLYFFPPALFPNKILTVRCYLRTIEQVIEMDRQPRCPQCHSEAFNKYGRTLSGKQRFLCLVCNRQFVLGSARREIKYRPICPACNREMHIYRREKGLTRFRCSAYPECRTYMKVPQEQNRS